MGKTKRKQPEWMREDDRWMKTDDKWAKKSSKNFGPSRRSKKQDFEQEINEAIKNDNFDY